MVRERQVSPADLPAANPTVMRKVESWMNQNLTPVMAVAFAMGIGVGWMAKRR